MTSEGYSCPRGKGLQGSPAGNHSLLTVPCHASSLAVSKGQALCMLPWWLASAVCVPGADSDGEGGGRWHGGEQVCRNVTLTLPRVSVHEAREGQHAWVRRSLGTFLLHLGARALQRAVPRPNSSGLCPAPTPVDCAPP